jgi:hypothetical protein
MDGDRLAPLVGILGCLGVIAALLYPYVAVDGAVGAYYSFGALNPLVAGVLGLVGVIIFAAGREGRTDPSLAAGAGLVLGVFMLVVTLAWAVTAPLDAVRITPVHRWTVAVPALLVVVGSLWYARVLRIF